MSRLLLLSLALVACDRAAADDHGKVRINEVMPSNAMSAVDNFQQADDWIELHAPDEDVSLDGWFISDNLGNPLKHALPNGLVVPKGGTLLLWADRAPLQGDTHLPFALSSMSPESVVLTSPDRLVVDHYSWSTTTPDVSFARLPDADGDFALCRFPTPGALNGTDCDGP